MIDTGIVDVGHRGLVWIILLFGLAAIFDGMLRVTAIAAKVIFSATCLFLFRKGRTEM